MPKVKESADVPQLTLVTLAHSYDEYYEESYV